MKDYTTSEERMNNIMRSNYADEIFLAFTFLIISFSIAYLIIQINS